MTLVALFAMTAGAWAEETTVYKSAVAISNLKQGDILAQGFSLTGSEIVYIVANRHKEDGTVGTHNKITFFDANTTYGENSSFIKNGVCYTPVDADGNDGNAWEVKEIVQGSPYIQGITYSVPGEMTLNAAKTEATMEMPGDDVTVDYELVRDMAVSMTTKVGDGNDGFRIRIKKDNQTGKFVPAEMTPQAMAGLITVTDDIEEKTLTNVTDYTVSIFAVDDNDLPTGNAIAFADLVPGRYVAIATAADGTAYDGQTPQSNVLVLFQGYEVTVPAKEFVTYYKDEPLYADPETSTAAQLYTISSVSDSKAVLSSAIETAPKNTPLLVYNSGDEAKTFLLIPANAEPNLALTVAPEFQGTLEATQIAASTASQSNYALNGTAFVWVKNAVEIAANKAWLSIPMSTARSISLVFDDATGVRPIDNGQLTIDNWYDLSGRKVATPTKKGIYVKNGKKVVVK